MFKYHINKIISIKLIQYIALLLSAPAIIILSILGHKATTNPDISFAIFALGLISLIPWMFFALIVTEKQPAIYRGK